MKLDCDLNLASRIIFLTILGIVVGYAFFSMIKISEAKTQKQADRMEEIIKKAAAQCYALEGCYPEDLYYLSKYGVIFDDDAFYYRYNSSYIGNYMMEIDVVAK
ncbi:MAG: hypothetical protein LBU32_25860 [Clostridiales bacterium]|jgi:uncharacterized membrane protein (Fun14 family)|nr:hypothetical protein [Clostridiales bacterium]